MKPAQRPIQDYRGLKTINRLEPQPIVPQAPRGLHQSKINSAINVIPNIGTMPGMTAATKAHLKNWMNGGGH